MRGFIYFIRNTVTGGGYVGQTAERNPIRRWTTHKGILRGGRGNARLQHSYNKHGEDAFAFEVLEAIDADDLVALRKALTLREDAWMVNLRAKGVDIYNLKSAEESMAGKPAVRAHGPSWNKGLTMSEEHRARISQTKTGVPSPKKGIPMSEEQRLKVVTSLKGNQRRKGTTTSEEGRANISASKKGKTSPNKGKAMSDDQKRKLSAAKTGSTHASDTLAKMRESAKGRTWTLVNGIRVYSGIKSEGAA